MMRAVFKVRFLLFALVISGLVAAAFSLINLRMQIMAIGDGAATGPVWFISGIERDLQGLQLSLASYEFGNATSQNVNLQFDILWSRVVGAGVGEAANKLAHYEIDHSIFDEVMSVLRQYEETVVNIDTASSVAILELFSELILLNEPIHDLSVSVLQATGNETKSWRIALLNISETNVFISVIIVSAVLILMIMLWFDGMTAQREIREKDRLLVKAEAANEAKSQFISVINHELRTPLTSIKGIVSLMTAGAFGDIPERFITPIKIAERNCAQLGSLISDVLDFEKFSSGNMEYHLNQFNLRQFLLEQTETNKPFAEVLGVILVADPSIPDLMVEADSKRVGQVMSNLISNAAKFSKPGDKVIVALRKVENRAVVSITDTGRGIPESARERIFDRFQQVDSSDVREHSGTGLGLSIVKSIVEAHGGAIEFDSVVGQGTTFRFDLSLAA